MRSVSRDAFVGPVKVNIRVFRNLTLNVHCSSGLVGSLKAYGLQRCRRFVVDLCQDPVLRLRMKTRFGEALQSPEQ